MQGYLPAGRAGSVPHFRTHSRIPQWVPGAGHGDAEETNRILVSTSVVDVGESYALTEVRTPSSGGKDGGEGGGGVRKGFLEEVPLSLQIPVPGTEQVPPLQLLTFGRDPLPSPGSDIRTFRKPCGAGVCWSSRPSGCAM